MEEVKQNFDIDEIIKKLKVALTLNEDGEAADDSENISKILDDFLDAGQPSHAENVTFTIDDMNVLITLLKHKSKVIVTKTAKTIAEFARTKEGREKCTQNDLVILLINLLKEDDMNLMTQSCRALGNICYENAAGNKMVQENNGLSLVLKVLKMSVDMKNEYGASFLRYVSAGFLLNSLADQPAELQQKALNEGLISIVTDALEIDGVTNVNSAMHALLILETLNDGGHHFLDERLAKVLVAILDVDLSTELSELCLALLQGQSENGETKLLLAKAGVCDSLLKLLEKHVSECVDEQSRTILKTACDFVVFIMTGELSMNLLYADGEGVVYKKLHEWLVKKDCDEDLHLTAVLAMGNFATSDSHCQQMVANGVHKHLFELLKANSSSKSNIRFQHALLSAVRNLVIPPVNKQIMLADGLIDVVYPMLEIQIFPVAFKLLGTLRMVIDGQKEAAISLGMRDGLLKRAVEWCDTEAHLGVQAEASRLLAWLVINSCNKKLICSMIDHGVMPHLVKMITVPQALMQNEALMSLTIIATMALEECEKQLMSSDITKSLGTFITSSALNLESPIVENALSLVYSIVKSETIKKSLKESNLLVELKKCEQKMKWTETMTKKVAMINNLLGD